MKNKLLYIIPSFILGLILGVALFRYHEYYGPHESPYDMYTTNQTYSIDRLEERVKDKGDISAYEALHGYFREGESGDFLYYAMIMANKYNNAQACEDVYYAIEEEYYPDSAIFKMDDKTRIFALHYLKLAAQKNDTSARDKIEQFKKMNIPASWLR